MHDESNVKSSYKAQLGSLFVACVAVATTPSRTEAQLFYDFISGAGTLATLELSRLPASHHDVVGLSFSVDGQRILGYLGTYSGTFDVSNGFFVDDSVGGLAADLSRRTSNFLDTDPPSNDLYGPEVFLILAGEGPADAIGFPGVENPGPLVAGTWRLVPEPSTTTLCLTAVLFGAVLRRRRKH